MNLIVEARHMEVTESMRDYVETKVSKLEKYFTGIHTVEVVMDLEAEQQVVEIVVTASKKHTFVATARAEDMYASVDQCVDKVGEQLRRHKDKVRDRQGPPKGTA